jgi:early secretory antigenic target protein ESAT-6
MTKIVVNYAALENAHAQMQSIARTLEQKLDTLRSGLQRIEWDGQDQTAYHAHQQAWDTAVRDLNQILNEIGAAVGLAKENYLSTEMSNARAWGQ